MNVEEIKQAVDDGKVVHWCNGRYSVCKWGDGYYIEDIYNASIRG